MRRLLLLAFAVVATLASKSATATSSASATASSTSSSTATSLSSLSPTTSSALTSTVSPTVSVTPSPLASVTYLEPTAASALPSVTALVTAASSGSALPSVTALVTATSSGSASSMGTAASSGSATATLSAGATATGSGSATTSATGSAAASGTAPGTASGTASGSATATLSAGATATGSGSATTSATGSAAASGTAPGTVSGTATGAATGTASASGIGSASARPSGSATASATVTATNSPMPTTQFGVSLSVRGVAGTTAFNLAVAAQLRCAAATAAGVPIGTVALARVTDTLTGYVAAVPAASALNAGDCTMVYGDAFADDVWLLPPSGARALAAAAQEPQQQQQQQQRVGKGTQQRRAQTASLGFTADLFVVLLPPQGSPGYGAAWAAARAAALSDAIAASSKRAATLAPLITAVNSATGVSAEALTLMTAFSCAGVLRNGTYTGACTAGTGSGVGGGGSGSAASSNTSAIVAGVLTPIAASVLLLLARDFLRRAKAPRPLPPPQLQLSAFAPGGAAFGGGGASQAAHYRTGLGQTRASLARDLAAEPLGGATPAAPPEVAARYAGRYPLSSLAPASSPSGALPPHLRGGRSAATATASPMGTVYSVNPMQGAALGSPLINPGLLAADRKQRQYLVLQGRQ